MRWQTLMVMLLVAAPAAAQTHTLAEPLKAGDCFRIRLNMKLNGEMRFQRDGKMVPIRLEATAEHAFPEHTLAVGKAGTAEKVARSYEKASAAISVGQQHSERTLRSQRHLVVAQRYKDLPLVFSPSGPLLRTELELTSEHFDTLCLVGLLPGKAVAIGDTWKVSNTVAQALCHFEGLAAQDLTCKLEQVEGKTARVSVKGKASGIDVGALVKQTIDATYRFDLAAGHLVWLEWKQKDEREQGPASPASTVETITTITRDPISVPVSLNKVALVPVPEGAEVPLQMLQLDYQDPKGRFDLLYTRQWHIVSQTAEHLVMRLLDRGDFVCQVTITPWTRAAKGKHLSSEEFTRAMSSTPGWQPEREVQTGVVPADKGRWIYRLSQHGRLDGIEVIQTFYLVAHEDGRQVVLAFTMTPRQAERIGTRDLSLAGSLDFPRP
jgi:hypothetical protein